MLNVSVNVTDSGPVDRPDLRDTLSRVADDWTHQIADRTRSGRDVDGRQLRPKADGAPSRLHDTGALLASLRADVGETGFTIAPTGKRNRQIAAIHQNTGRAFMGASADQIDSACRAVVEALRR